VSSIEAPHVETTRVIQLHHPKAKKAISKQLLQELSGQIEEIHEETTNRTRALVLASTVDDVFCAGADLKERRCMSPEETQDF